MGNPIQTRKEKKSALIKEIQANRERFFRRMAVQAVPETNRLRLAYKNILKDIQLEQTVVGMLTELKPGDVQNQRFLQSLYSFEASIRKDLKSMESAIVDSTATLQTNGTLAGYQIGLANLNASGVSARFNQPNLEAIQASIHYVDSDPFRAAIANYAPYHAEQVSNLIISGVSVGKNPRDIARLVKNYLVDSPRPLFDALRIARTTQLYSARQGLSQTYAKNGVEKWIWVCSLGLRTCAACWAMHGTIHPVTETCNDHHNGRCTQAPLTPRWADLGLDGQDVTVMAGETLFNQLPDEQQKSIMGPRFWEAYQDGLFKFSQLSTTYSNPIFGDMRRKSTLQELVN